ncbi:transcription termination/antitermination protein NusG [Halothiobacillus sp. DCM-1]|uniref:transcription termination/antitermination protein NusG n=1 Tax=Halothiobacillus sp. DCM-1 TaxID=3112558 RepID=UPI00324D7B00
MAMRWYVVQAFSQFENSVKKALAERIERAGLQAQFGEILVPSEEVVEVRDGVKRKSERKFYPGYVLVQIDMTDDAWHLVNSVPRVLGFVGDAGGKPTPISQKEADAIMARVRDSSDKPKPKTLFDVGEMVRVCDGPFNDFTGVVEEVSYEKSRLQVAVSIFGRSTPVELGFDQVAKT